MIPKVAIAIFASAIVAFGCQAPQETVEVAPKIEAAPQTTATDETPKEAPSLSNTVKESPQPPVISEADLSVPFYPGSIEKPGASYKTSTDEKNFLSVRTTPDAPAKVQKFYEAKVEGLKMDAFETKEGTTILGTVLRKDRTRISLTILRKPGSKTTEISLGSAVEK